ncbi:MAG: hypothetical protein E2598_06315 [Sphingobium sp.]|nr:hypothetical protein [Sphingobium sp.]
MTIIRKPATFEKALKDISDLLGWDGCADVLGKSESHLRKLGTPDTDRELSIRDAVRLDAAYRRAGGEGAPLFDCYALKLDIHMPSAPACTDTMLSGAQKVAKESGEAVAAIIELAGNLGSEKARTDALREIEEAVADLTRLARRITATVKQETVQ